MIEYTLNELACCGNCKYYRSRNNECRSDMIKVEFSKSNDVCNFWHYKERGEIYVDEFIYGSISIKEVL